MVKKHEIYEWQNVKSETKNPTRMTKLRSKRIRLIFLIGLIFTIFPMTGWYFFIRIPDVYGQITFSRNLSTKTELVFEGKKYEEVILGKFSLPDYATKPYDGVNIGQVKSGDGPIIIRTVFGHPDMLVGYQRGEMSGWWLFQEEK